MNWNRNQAPIQWGKLISACLSAAVTVLLFKLSLFMAELPEPLHKLSLLALAISLLIAILSIRSLWLWLQSLTIVSTLKFIFIAYVISVLVMAIVTTGEGGFFQAIFRSAGQVPMIAIQKSYDNLLSLLDYPLAFSRAYNSRNSSTSVNALPANESITIDLDIPNSTSNRKVTPGTGMLVTMNIQAKQSCQLDALSDETFFDLQEAVVIEGPRFEEGAVWWRLRNEAGTGWCPEDMLS